MDREAIMKTLRRELSLLRSQYGVRRLAVFGSVGRGDATPTSDVDILVDFDGPATFERYMGVRFHLEDTLGLKVDLLTRKGLRPELKARIEADAVHVA